MDLKNDINIEIREVENVVLFEYDDKKIFEKFKIYKVEI